GAAVIVFHCPGCGEEMEIRDRMAGRRVRCTGCDDLVPVPDTVTGLSVREFLLFGLLFLLVPAANVWVSSILYYVLKRDQPRRANQVNQLGLAVFAVPLLAAVLIVTLANAK